MQCERDVKAYSFMISCGSSSICATVEIQEQGIAWPIPVLLMARARMMVRPQTGLRDAETADCRPFRWLLLGSHVQNCLLWVRPGLSSLVNALQGTMYSKYKQCRS